LKSFRLKQGGKRAAALGLVDLAGAAEEALGALERLGVEPA